MGASAGDKAPAGDMMGDEKARSCYYENEIHAAEMLVSSKGENDGASGSTCLTWLVL